MTLLVFCFIVWNLILCQLVLPLKGLKTFRPNRFHRSSVSSDYYSVGKRCRYRMVINQAASADCDEDTDTDFDLPTSLVLAGYAFDSYNTPNFGKVSQRLDNVRIIYPSTNFTNTVFDGVLMITLEKGSVRYDDSSVPILLRLLNGKVPDPFIHMSSFNSILTNDGSIEGFYCDSVISSTRANDQHPNWKETHFLFLKDLHSAEIEFAAYDQQNWGDDVFIGNGFVSIVDLMQRATTPAESLRDGDRDSCAVLPFEEVTVPIPLYAERVDFSNPDLSFDSIKRQLFDTLTGAPVSGRGVLKKKRFRTGTLKVRLRLIPWTRPAISDNFVQGERISTTTEVFDYMAETVALEVEQNAHDFELFARNISALMNERYDANNSVVSSALEAVDRIVDISTGRVETAFLSERIVDDASKILRNAESAEGKVYRNLPKGASGELALWEQLLPSIFMEKNESSESRATEQDLVQLLARDAMQHVCTIDATISDTQVTLWADTQSRVIVISFRGTEIDKLQDILTDINFFLVPFNPDLKILNGVMVHQGFRDAYLSVREALFQQLLQIFSSASAGNKQADWKIYCTGHSLGAALSTLFSFDIARMRAGYIAADELTDRKSEDSTFDQLLRSFFNQSLGTNTEVSRDMVVLPASRLPNAQVDYSKYRHTSSQSSEVHIDPTQLYMQNGAFRKAIDGSSIIVYNYGSPRVGNTEFKRMYESMVSRCFRVVNQQDVVARIPRSSKASVLLDYEHVGRTVFINDAQILNESISHRIEKDSGELSHGDIIPSSLWIEGISNGTCPLRDVSLLTTDINATEFLSGKIQNEVFRIIETQLSEATRDLISEMSSSSAFKQVERQQLSDLLSLSWISLLDRCSSQAANMADGGESTDSIRLLTQTIVQISTGSTNVSEVMNHYGAAMGRAVNTSLSLLPQVDLGFVERELQMLISMVNMSAIEHHLEPAYYIAFKHAVDEYNMRIERNV